MVRARSRPYAYEVASHPCGYMHTFPVAAARLRHARTVGGIIATAPAQEQQRTARARANCQRASEVRFPRKRGQETSFGKAEHAAARNVVHDARKCVSSSSGVARASDHVDCATMER